MRMGSAAVAAAILLLVAGPAAGQVLQHPQPGEPDPYAGWRDRSAISCCGGQDCAPATPCRVDGQDGWLEAGRCWPLPPDREMPTPPAAVWDRGDLHVCRRWGPIPGVGPQVLCWAMARGA